MATSRLTTAARQNGWTGDGLRWEDIDSLLEQAVEQGEPVNKHSMSDPDYWKNAWRFAAPSPIRAGNNETLEQSHFSDEFDEDEDELRELIEIGRRVREGARSAGRPSKVDDYEQQIRNGDTDLETAKDELSYKTWKKLETRFDQKT